MNPIDRSSSAEVEARDGLLAMRGISLEDFDDMLAGCSTCWADDFSREEVEGLAAWHLTDGSGLEDIGLCLSSERRKDWSEGTPSWVEQFGEAKAIAEQEAEQRAAAGD